MNVFQLPQTIEDIHKILGLPCQGNEQLLDAIVEEKQKIQFRPQAHPHLILVTDEPSTGQHTSQAVLQLCLETRSKASVIGTFDPFQQGVTVKTNGVWVPIPDGKTTKRPNW